jgi:hypothetical protein
MNSVPYTRFNTIPKPLMTLSEQYQRYTTITSIQIPCLLMTYNHLLLLICFKDMGFFIVTVTGYNRELKFQGKNNIQIKK